ncbi:MAG: tRNA (adenosine(37)-N6)-threonylcarbamoyltransferase complex transferase subunit TsaD [Synergistaceae bacterium]|nr:tRNA (adenosine(37)-N6)-threonylcarbamoyltransferase complex transferase subunit TsaD [Synergistaceae bacterium]
MTERGEKGFVTLGVETSCDDTALALIDEKNNVLADLISSQIDSHSAYGGVVPELASRMHQEAILPLLERLFAKAGVKEPRKEISLVAVTSGPGLMGSLLVGVMTAKALAQGWDIPLIGVNHLEGHIFAAARAVGERQPRPPFISLIVSGGHTEIVLVRKFGDYELLGFTRDDAAGEAFDKVSKTLGLGYPGGPAIDRLAASGSAEAFTLPIPLASTKEIEFSFSGLKTAAITLIEKERERGGELPLADICASFQRAVVESLLIKLKLAVKKSGVKQITLSGGVAANSALRSALAGYAAAKKIELFLPPRAMCTDNAVMIAAAGYNSYMRGNRSDLRLSPNPSWSLW